MRHGVHNTKSERYVFLNILRRGAVMKRKEEKCESAGAEERTENGILLCCHWVPAESFLWLLYLSLLKKEDSARTLKHLDSLEATCWITFPLLCQVFWGMCGVGPLFFSVHAWECACRQIRAALHVSLWQFLRLIGQCGEGSRWLLGAAGLPV